MFGSMKAMSDLWFKNKVPWIFDAFVVKENDFAKLLFEYFS